MTGWFVWINGLKGPQAQKWDQSTYDAEKHARSKGEGRPKILSETFLDSARWPLTLKELCAIYPYNPPADEQKS